MIIKIIPEEILELEEKRKWLKKKITKLERIKPYLVLIKLSTGHKMELPVTKIPIIIVLIHTQRTILINWTANQPI